MTFSLPSDSRQLMYQLLRKLDDYKDHLHIAGYGVSDTSLEEVLSFVLSTCVSHYKYFIEVCTKTGFFKLPIITFSSFVWTTVFSKQSSSAYTLMVFKATILSLFLIKSCFSVKIIHFCWIWTIILDYRGGGYGKQIQILYKDMFLFVIQAFSKQFYILSEKLYEIWNLLGRYSFTINLDCMTSSFIEVVCSADTYIHVSLCTLWCLP